MAGLDDIYQDRILIHAGEITRQGTLEKPDVSAEAVSPICGSRLKVDISVSGSKVDDYAQEVDACALGSASASIMGKVVIGRTAEEIEQAAVDMERMLSGDGEGPSGPFAEFQILKAAIPFENRHRSILLPFTALKKAFESAGVS